MDKEKQNFAIDSDMKHGYLKRKQRANFEDMLGKSWFTFILNFIIFLAYVISLKFFPDWSELILVIILLEFIVFSIPPKIYEKKYFVIVNIILFSYIALAMAFQLLALPALIMMILLFSQKIRMDKYKKEEKGI